MIRILSLLLVNIMLLSCTNSADFSKGEIELISILRDGLAPKKAPETFIDARKLVTREKIDASGLEVLFVELESGQNGTSVKYPGHNVGEVWLGVDGTTITFERGFLIATRGLGDDLMSSTGNFPALLNITDSVKYQKTMNWLYRDNQPASEVFTCTATIDPKKYRINVFEKEFSTRLVKEICKSDLQMFQNEYFFESTGLLRRSKQFHSSALGYLFIQRLD